MSEGVPKKTVLQNLSHHRQWVAGLAKAKPSRDGARRAESVMVGCVQTVNECGRSIADWLGRRKERRSMLTRIRETYTTRRGRKALLDLIDLAASELEAAAWVEEILVRSLPLKRTPRRLSESHKAALQAGRDRSRQRAALSARLAAARRGSSGPPGRCW